MSGQNPPRRRPHWLFWVAVVLIVLVILELTYFGLFTGTSTQVDAPRSEFELTATAD
jgi:hypothetical protein